MNLVKKFPIPFT